MESSIDLKAKVLDNLLNQIRVFKLDKNTDLADLAEIAKRTLDEAIHGSDEIQREFTDGQRDEQEDRNSVSFKGMKIRREFVKNYKVTNSIRNYNRIRNQVLDECKSLLPLHPIYVEDENREEGWELLY